MKPKLKTIITPIRSCLGQCEHDITVRRINNGWHIRVLTNGTVNQEIRVDHKEHIRLAVADLLRWEDKLGNISNMATASRERNAIKGLQ